MNTTEYIYSEEEYIQLRNSEFLEINGLYFSKDLVGTIELMINASLIDTLDALLTLMPIEAIGNIPHSFHAVLSTYDQKRRELHLNAPGQYKIRNVRLVVTNKINPMSDGAEGEIESRGIKAETLQSILTNINSDQIDLANNREASKAIETCSNMFKRLLNYDDSLFVYHASKGFFHKPFDRSVTSYEFIYTLQLLHYVHKYKPFGLEDEFITRMKERLIITYGAEHYVEDPHKLPLEVF